MKEQLKILIEQMLVGGIYYSEAVSEFKKNFIWQVLAAFKGNQCKAAKALGMHRNTLARTCDELGIDPSIFRPEPKRKRPMRLAILQKAESA